MERCFWNIKWNEKEYKVSILYEYHNVNCIYGGIEKHGPGTQSKSAETCLFQSTRQPFWGKLSGAAGRGCHL